MVEELHSQSQENTSGTAHRYLASTLNSWLKWRMHNCLKQTLENREGVCNGLMTIALMSQVAYH